MNVEEEETTDNYKKSLKSEKKLNKYKKEFKIIIGFL